MIKNPFTPAEMATQPDTFFGRSVELGVFARAVQQGCVAIQGSVGIGKSSLLSRSLLHMDGFASSEKCHTVMAVGHRDIQSIDDAARLVLEKLVKADAAVGKFTVGIPNVVQYESAEAYDYFKEGRHLAALVSILKQEALLRVIDKRGKLILAVDEADKCARPVARLVRSVCSETQLEGIRNIRFVLAGVSPFVEEMIREDEGVARFIYKVINLEPLVEDEARTLLEAKFEEVLDSLNDDEVLEIDPQVIERVLRVSGGHPHLLQLLGSHVIERECQDPDGILDSKDLVDAFREICYESRAPIYERLLHDIQLEGIGESFSEMIRMAGGGFPGRIPRRKAEDRIELNHLRWLTSRGVISIASETEYAFVDEFLRVRVLLDNDDSTGRDLPYQLATGEYIDLSEVNVELWGAEDHIR